MHLRLSREEYEKMIWGKMLLKDNCPFCVPDENINKVVWRWNYWNILINLAPYTWDDNHIMATPVSHKKFFHEFDNQELLELKKVHEFVQQYYKGWEYFSATRETFGNRSVEHYHTHFLPGKMKQAYIIQMLDEQGLVTK